MKPFRAQRGANIFDFRFTFLRKLKHFRAQRGAKFFDFSSIRAKNNFELTFHNSFMAHQEPGIINNFFHNGIPAGRINHYYEKAQGVQYPISKRTQDIDTEILYPISRIPGQSVSYILHPISKSI